MKRDPESRYYMQMPDSDFPVDIIHRTFANAGTMIPRHWHEHMQFFFFVEGEASVTCGSRAFTARAGDLVIVNPCELHGSDCLVAPTRWEVIRVDFAFLSSRYPDVCQTRFIQPLERGGIVFENLVRDDSAVAETVARLIAEYGGREPGFELAVKASLYCLLSLLFRSHCVRRLDQGEMETQERNVERLSRVFDYIEKNASTHISLEALASLAGVTEFHFCKIFRAATEMTPVEYVNRERINRGENLLRETGMTVTEIARECGFDDASYFSRVFRRYRGVSPKLIRSGVNGNR